MEHLLRFATILADGSVVALCNPRHGDSCTALQDLQDQLAEV